MDDDIINNLLENRDKSKDQLTEQLRDDFIQHRFSAEDAPKVHQMMNDIASMPIAVQIAIIHRSTNINMVEQQIQQTKNDWREILMDYDMQRRARNRKTHYTVDDIADLLGAFIERTEEFTVELRDTFITNVFAENEIDHVHQLIQEIPSQRIAHQLAILHSAVDDTGIGNLELLKEHVEHAKNDAQHCVSILDKHRKG